MQKQFFKKSLVLLKSNLRRKVQIVLIGLLSLSTFLTAQSDYITIQKIEVTGNKKTKENVIIRELDFSIGDTIHLNNIPVRTAKNQALLMNTSLFTSVKTNIKNWNTETNAVTIVVEVSEFWFIYPFPIIELNDRNFNEWWQTYNHSLKRVNIGVRFYHINLTGRNDRLEVLTQFGFTQKYEIGYDRPGINKKQTLGVFTNVLYSQNKELSYNVKNDTLEFFRDPDEVLLRRIRGGFGMKYRPSLYTSYKGVLNYHHNIINEKVSQELNPDFFKEGLKQRYFSLNFSVDLDKRDIRPYPMNGHQVIFSIEKQGIGLFKEFNAGHAYLTLKKYISISKKWSTELIGKGQLGLIRSQQPFYNYLGLGYEIDFIRGYELYVINGLDYAYAKTRLRFELFNFIFDWREMMPIRQFKSMPIKWYLSFNSDFGYVNDPFFSENNSLRNQLLWGGGVGLDIVVFYDKVFQIEYSVNRLGERGVFIHWNLNF
ncbi:MAG: outer membrane protein assembly factor BamA [Saprospiraceae bacterium]|jgi:outer membrane protein assembly factor BamA